MLKASEIFFSVGIVSGDEDSIVGVIVMVGWGKGLSEGSEEDGIGYGGQSMQHNQLIT